MRGDARINIGGVARAHGIRGEVVIVTHDPDSETLGAVTTIWVGGVARTITKARDTHRGWLVAFEGIATRNDAELLRGQTVEIDRDQLELDDDDVLLADLIGCEVRRPDGSPWGTVAAVEAGDHQDLLVIHAGAMERLLPLVDEFVTSIDLDARVITVDPPEGLPESRAVERVKFTVVTLLPELIEPALGAGVVGRAREAGVIAVNCITPREFTHDKHRTVDDTPYGGGPGMVMKPEPLLAAIAKAGPGHRILLSPAGAPLTQARVRELAQLSHVVLVCGRYEGVDERVIETAIDEQLSIGDYVLSGGELGALVVIDAVSRLIPGVLGESTSADDESFSEGLLEYPQYTRPAELDGRPVPADPDLRQPRGDRGLAPAPGDATHGRAPARAVATVSADRGRSEGDAAAARSHAPRARPLPRRRSHRRGDHDVADELRHPRSRALVDDLRARRVSHHHAGDRASRQGRARRGVVARGRAGRASRACTRARAHRRLDRDRGRGHHRDAWPRPHDRRDLGQGDVVPRRAARAPRTSSSPKRPAILRRS